MAKRSIKSSAINWRHEPKGPGYAEHVYVTLTDGRRAELLGISQRTPTAQSGSTGRSTLTAIGLARLALRYTSRTNAAGTSRS
jgi:hypothetical protein